MCSPSVFSGVRVTRSLVVYVCFVDRCLSFVLFRLAIVLSVLLRYTDYDYPFGIIKLFLPIFINAGHFVNVMRKELLQVRIEHRITLQRESQTS